MRYTLIDNSTLSSVQRLLGMIKIKNKHVIDGDILAFENFIQAVLFYDKIFYLDDYKEQYRYSRNEFFKTLLPIVPNEVGYNELLLKSKVTTEGIIPCIQGGKLKDSDFAPFFELLKMNVVFSWDLSSSSYYLTMKMLESVGGIDIKKYSKLSSMIFSELIDRSVKESIPRRDPLLFDSHGNVITPQYTVFDKEGRKQETGLSKQTEAFFAGLNWLAFRTTLYTLAAKELNIDLVLHPIRNAFQVNLLKKTNTSDHAVFEHIIHAMNGIASSTLNKVLNASQPFLFKSDLPMFTAYLAKKTGNPDEFINAAYELREERVFVEARAQLISLEDLMQSNPPRFIEKANALVLDVQKQMQRICIKYKVESPQGLSLSPIIYAWNISTLSSRLPQLPDFGTNIKSLDFMRDLIPRKGFATVYKEIINGLTHIERLGKLHDIIVSNVQLDDEAAFYDNKSEKPQYERAKSNWKIPM